LRWVSLVLCSAALLAPALAPAAATADADPASDVLLQANVFYPYTVTISPALRRTLNQEVAAAHGAGFPIKVALIVHAYDLGAIPTLFGQPKRYAKFLDTEISFQKLQPVLIVMPAGLAGSGLGQPATAVLGKLPPPANAQPDTIAQATISAVPLLAAAAGHPIGGGGKAPATSTASGSSAALPIGIAVAIALVLAALAFVTLRDRRRRAENR
jgi:hypothetical protein